jgi:hypothetical protein
MPSSKSKPIVVKLPDGTSPSSTLFAYVVNSDGKVVEKAPFKGLEARLDTSGEALKGSRFFVGAEFPAEYPTAKIDAFALAQAQAYQVSTSVNKDNAILLQRIPSQVIGNPIPISFCEVQGNVSNTLTINGVPQSGPVCKAKVHICTVEWFYRWPIWLRPVVPAAIVNSLKDSIANLHVKSTSATNRAPRARASADALTPIPADVENALLGATPDTIHEIVFNNAAILIPYFCFWEVFWPWFHRVVEQEVVYTDCNGHFDGWLIGVGTAVQENVYIWVEASIGGNWVTVYKPPFPCHTYWNYACGTEINISLDNAAIAPCNCNTSVVDGSAWFTAIGGYGIALNIQQDITSVYAPADIRNVGCTNFVDPHSNQLCPFGSELNLYLAFGPTLPATHYRWSWTYVLDSSTTPIAGAPTNQITGAVERYYLWPLADGSWETGSVALMDTDSNGNIAYKIPNYDAAAYTGVSEAEWVSFNFLSASLDSTKLSNGYVIRLDLELLNINASGPASGQFEALSVPVKTFQISVDTNAAAAYDGCMPAPYTANGSGNNYLTLDPKKPGNALSFSLKVKVDNSAVTAQINPPSLLNSDGSSAGPAGPCGVMQFADQNSNPQSVKLSFVASEPFKFATFSYGVVRGSSGAVAGAEASGYVFANAPPYTLSGGVYSTVISVSNLLHGCPSAAFAETLSVGSLATDGSVALSETGWPYSASDVNAFALTPAGS